MDKIWQFVRDNPWIWAVAAVAMVLWVWALWVIFHSAKFGRKWLWVLVSLISFTYSWEIAPATMFGIGLPVGSLYVLWYWRFSKRGDATVRASAQAAEVTRSSSAG